MEMEMEKLGDSTVQDHWSIYHFYFYFHFLFPHQILDSNTALVSLTPFNDYRADLSQCSYIVSIMMIMKLQVALFSVVDLYLITTVFGISIWDILHHEFA